MRIQDLAAKLPDPIWVLGTDTHVGKTWVAKSLAQAWAASGPVTYRKPFQTGVPDLAHPDADASVVKGTGIEVESHVILREALSPLAAAEAEARELELAETLAWMRRPHAGHLVAEGVGGLMVPLWGATHFLAWATELKWPCLLVARGGLGTLNHSLLSAEALMLRGWRVEALLVNPGADGSHRAAEKNAELLQRFLPLPVHLVEGA